MGFSRMENAFTGPLAGVFPTAEWFPLGLVYGLDLKSCSLAKSFASQEGNLHSFSHSENRGP